MSADEKTDVPKEEPKDAGAVFKEPAPVKQTTKDVEKEQEAQLRSKYPSMALKGPGSSAFLQKRLSKGQKYFDSGDYNMAKAKKGGVNKAPLPSKQLLIPTTASTGDEIPTPEMVQHRKPSLIQSKLVS